MLKEPRLFGDKDLVAEAIATLREHEPPEGYYLAFSGGKDSIVIKKLADMASVKYDAVYSVTTIDPPPRKIHSQTSPRRAFRSPKRTVFDCAGPKGIPDKTESLVLRIIQGTGRQWKAGIDRNKES